MGTRDLGTYEMLWSCGACGTKGLLGKSHRHCPSCGSPQDPKARYFPQPGEETAVANHSFDGADKICSACTTPMGAKAHNCGNCGAPLDGARAVGLVSEAVPVVREPPRPVRAGRSRGCLFAVVAGVVAIVAATLVFFLWKKEITVQVQQHRWEREIAIERLDPVAQSEWCDRLPSDAYSVSRSREVRDHKKIPDGQTCRTKNVDQGDGTFKKVEECSPKYREEPIYADKCRFTVDRWQKARGEVARGQGQQPAPAWPSVRLGRTGACRGCEREGARTERYLVDLWGGGAQHACDVGAARWAQLQDGASVPMKVRVVGGGADCDSVAR